MRSDGRSRHGTLGLAPVAIPDILAQLDRPGQPAAIRASAGVPGGEYGFLQSLGIDGTAIAAARAEAEACNVAVHEVLLASGAVTPQAYASTLADSLGLAVADWNAVLDFASEAESSDIWSVAPSAGGGTSRTRVLCAEDATPNMMRQRVEALQARGLNVALASRPRINAALERHFQRERMDRAVTGLFRRQPARSAAGPVWIWQIVAAAIVVGLIIGGFSVLPDATIAALTGVIALPFLCVTVLRVVGLREVVARSHMAMTGAVTGPQKVPDVPGSSLPVYSVLVPLFRETRVLPGLVHALTALNYPKAKLEIFLVLEAVDLETQAAILRMQLPGCFRTIVVPDRAPRTKPKALNYALQFARGDYVVVYDAEDRPEPDQLLRALATFRRHPPTLGCVQAQLNIYNPRASWFTRQFTIEYSALFDAILPALARLKMPVPLGGTSNHFPRELLVACGAWDPFNVTEDADLGFRLARQGLRTVVLPSTTWEEAPSSLGQWLRQRTRWLKGWMQTYLVHTRQPWRLNAELGVRGAIGFHALMGALILSALVHPVFYVLLTYHAAMGQLLTPAETLAGTAFWTIAWINLGAGYIVSILVGMLSVWRRGRRYLILHALMMPVTWLLMSAAAYRALYQLFRDPFLWEKTEHGVGME